MSFIETIFEKLQRHPKRIAFPDGTDVRVLTAAAEFSSRKLGIAVLLGKKDHIQKVAEKNNISLNRIKIIDPETADDLPLFQRHLETLSRYRNIDPTEGKKILANPNYFGTMLLQYGQVDGLVGGAQSAAGSLLRPLFQFVKPLTGVKSISSCMLMEIPNCEYGQNGMFVMADCTVIPSPTVDQLASTTIESAKIFRQLTGETPRVAMLSHSTKGSATSTDTGRILAAMALARQHFIEHNLGIEIDGEIQADAAIVPAVAEAKNVVSPVAGKANVLIFPDLNSGNIASKMIQHLCHANAYGQILLGLDKPAGDVSRGSSASDILGVAAIVGLQAVNYRRLYPEQGARYTDEEPVS